VLVVAQHAVELVARKDERVAVGVDSDALVGCAAVMQVSVLHARVASSTGTLPVAERLQRINNMVVCGREAQ
jgi:hypothetical protein